MTVVDRVWLAAGMLFVIGNNNAIRVTGPGGFSAPATYVSINLSTNGTPRTTKRIYAIQVQSDSGSGWQLIRQYTLGQNYSLYSDARTCPSTCGPDTTHRKLTLTSIQLVGKDGTTTLPATTFSYLTDGGTAQVAAGGWQRLRTVNNNQGGTVTFAYANIQTVTGKTMAENLETVSIPEHQDVIVPVSRAFEPHGGLHILRGNLAPEGAVIKTAGVKKLHHRGPARCFDREEDAMAAVLAQQVKAGETVIIRYEGPQGGPGTRYRARDQPVRPDRG